MTLGAKDNGEIPGASSHWLDDLGQIPPPADPWSAPSRGGTLDTRSHMVFSIQTGTLWSFHFSGEPFIDDTRRPASTGTAGQTGVFGSL